MDLAPTAAEALRLALTLLLPTLLATLAIGLILAFLELLAHSQDTSLSFVPRFLGVAAVLLLGHEFMSEELVRFTGRVFEHIALVAR